MQKPNVTQIQLLPNRAARRVTLKPYDDNGWQLIPLNRPGRLNAAGRRIGKHPLEKGWATKEYSNREVFRQYADTHNIGVRIGPGQAVLDVDPRNGGDHSTAKATLEHDFDPAAFPSVQTGGGGYHHYFTLPEGLDPLNIMQTHPDFPGWELKTKGQVVAAGSLHESGRLYVWRKECPPLSKISVTPDWLIKGFTRPVVDYAASGGGQHNAEETAKLLDVFDPVNFRDHGRWFELMCAVHHASAGDARAEFIAWSIADPNYSDHADIIGRRWDSLHTEKPGAITVRTLYKALVDAGHPELIPQSSAEDDFAGVDWDGVASGSIVTSPGILADNSPIARLNRKYCAVLNGGKFAVMYLDRDPERPGQRQWHAMSVDAFDNWLANRPRVQIGASTTPLSKAWLNSPDRKAASGTTVDPEERPGTVIDDNSEDEGALNLWTGWGVSPKPGKWDRLQAMLRDDLCQRNEIYLEYLLNWLAWKLQNPGEPAEVAIVIKGKKGSGKTTLGAMIVRIFGSHGIMVSDPDQFLGRFTGHLLQTCFVFADEAYWAGNRQQEGKLKALITSEDLTREAKYQAAVFVRNRVGLMIAGNERWLAPATMDERRFFILETSNKHVVPRGSKDHPNADYWRAIYNEIESGGREAFMQAMLTRNLGEWHPRYNIPQTQAMAETIVEGMQGVQKFWYESLVRGDLNVEDIRDHNAPSWNDGEQRVRARELTSEYLAWLRRNGSPASCSERAMLKELVPFGVQKSLTHKPRHWIVPELSVARGQFEKVLGGRFFDQEREVSEKRPK